MYTPGIQEVIALLGCGLYLGLSLITLLKRGLKESLYRLLVLFLVISLFYSLTLYISYQGYLNFDSNAAPLRISYFGVLLLSVSFYYLTRSLFQYKGRDLGWRVLALLWLIIYLLTDFKLLGIPDPIRGESGWIITYPQVRQGVLAFGWIVFMIGTAIIVTKTYRQSLHPLAKNRVDYWVLAFLLLITSDSLLFVGVPEISAILRWTGTLLSTIVIIRYYLPDFRSVERQVLRYLLLTLLTATILIIGFYVMPYILQPAPEYNTTLNGAVLVIILTGLLSLVWIFSQSIVDRLLPRTNYNSIDIIHQYSQNVSSVLEPDLLASHAIGLINEVIEIRNGYLFLVDHEKENGHPFYRLRLVKGTGEEYPVAGILSNDSPIAQYFVEKHQYLYQSDIDVKPQYQNSNSEELNWLSNLGVDIYIPIYTKDEWIGLFALGHKVYGTPYQKEDIRLISILADQTAVAIQNARLVESLMRLNNDFRRAYAAMEQANQHLKDVNEQLENLDRTKSNFIEIASHELRTPLSLMRGYTEILLEDPTVVSHPYHHKLVNGIYGGMMRLNEIVNSMVDIASIDTRTLKLDFEPVSIHALIHLSKGDYLHCLQERNITIDTDHLENLPDIDGDPEALLKAFNNIISNAIKFTPDGGNVSITGDYIPHDKTDLASDGIHVIVSDTGIGIAPDNLDLIFTKFYHTGELSLHSSGKSKFKGGGPGLGLAIAKGIFEAHGGRIWAESNGYDEEKCPGSKFHVLIPKIQV
jgi:signal transduction histidine kinase